MDNFYYEIAKLKNLLRRGWLLRNVNGRTESDAEHIFSMILLALETMSKNDLKLDQLKVVKMIAYHNLCEIDAGDITPVDKVDKEEKYKNEYACIQRLAKMYGMEEIEELWLEFSENKTPEAQFVRMLDKVDAVLQAKVYSEKDNKPELYEEFYNNNEKYNGIFSKLEIENNKKNL